MENATRVISFRTERYFMTTAATSPYLETLEQVITNVIAPAAFEIDRTGAFPRAALDALSKAGLLGLVSAKEVGGLGEAHRAATLERLAERLSQMLKWRHESLFTRSERTSTSCSRRRQTAKANY